MPKCLSKPSDIMYCQVCGKEFNGNKKFKYCSKECRQKARNARVSPKYTRNCLFCGKEFVTGRPDQVYCSRTDCKKKASYRRNKEQAQATIHKHYLNNKGLYIQRAKNWKEDHEEYTQEWERKYREENHDRICAVKKLYHERMKNDPKYQERRRISSESTRNRPGYKERCNAKSREYNKTPKGREGSRYRCAKRRTLKKNTIATLTLAEWHECLEYFDFKDAYTGLPMEIVSKDHVIPLKYGGSYSSSNIVPCERSVNSSKNAQDFFKWYRVQPFFSEKRLKKILRWTGLTPNSETQQIAMF